MPRKLGTLGSDHFMSRFNVMVQDFGFKSHSDDGRDAHDFDSADWYDTTIYNGILERRDGKYQLQMQWVDLENKAHKYILPHQVVEAIHRAYETIKSKSKSEGAKKAHLTRLENGTVPDQFLPQQ